MDVWSTLGYGMGVALTPVNLLFCFMGVLLGTLVGVLPGLGPAAAMALLLPLTFHLPPVSAMILLAGIYYGAMYGGSTTSILLNIPGEAGSIMTCLDGNQMAKQGRAGVALGISAFGSFIGGTITTIILTFTAFPLSKVALEFGPAEYFALMCTGIALLCFLSQGSFLKSLISMCGGLFVGTVGMDIFTGLPRYTFGIPSLYDGINLVVVLMGMFGVTEILTNLDAAKVKQTIITKKVDHLLPDRVDWQRSIKPILRGAALGSFFGMLPGGGTILSTFSSYAVEKKLSKNPESFGKGAIEGVAGPETANNSSSTAGFIPLLTLGIPTNPTVAMLMAALMVLGVQPGPLLIKSHPDIFWGVIMSMYIGNVMLMVLNLPLIGLWVQILKIPYLILFPIILLLCVIGAYSLNNNIIDVYLMIFFGVLGYAMQKEGFALAPFMLAMILEPILEMAFRQALAISGGHFRIFVLSPLAVSLLVVLVAVVIISTISPLMKLLRNALRE